MLNVHTNCISELQAANMIVCLVTLAPFHSSFLLDCSECEAS